MLSTKARIGIFFVETLNAIGTTCYFYYVFFFAQAKFGFGRLENLLLGAGLGLTEQQRLCGRGVAPRGIGRPRLDAIQTNHLIATQRPLKCQAQSSKLKAQGEIPMARLQKLRAFRLEPLGA